MKVYIASSLHNIARVKHFEQRFEEQGATITYKWSNHGQVFSEEELRKYAIGERDGVLECQLFFMVHPARFGAHVELGIAIANKIPIVILEETPIEQKTFYYLEGVFKFTTEDDAFNFAINKLKGIT